MTAATPPRIPPRRNSGRPLSFLFLAFVLLTPLFAPTGALAHGTEGKIDVEHGLLIRAKYSNGEPMAYANISISRAGDDAPFQQGNPVRKGRFLFLPDRNGTWTVEITDGMGQRLALSKQVEDIEQYLDLITNG